MQDHLEIEDLIIPVTLQRGKRKTLAIKITREGSLLIKAPRQMRENEIERFVRQKRYWIYKQTKRVLEENRNRVVRSEEETEALRKQAREILTERTDYYKEILKVDYQRIRIGNPKTRWGSCSSRGTISYNWHLILMPDRILDYVVVHELCHLLEMNHSPAFWKKVSDVLPDYQSRRKWLKENGNRYL
ncbi:MAG: M48 family metallopeptidase [Lachnospiraceae bacterium]